MRLISPLDLSSCELYKSYLTGEIRKQPFKNETEAKGLVLISFSRSLSLFFFLHEKQKCKNGNDTQHQKDSLNFIHYNSHELVELYLPSNVKRRRPGSWKKKQNPNKTIQSDCELM